MDVSLQGVEEAAVHLNGIVLRTPLLSFADLNTTCGTTVHLKCENMQHGGAFKLRGATNAVRLLTASEKARGVATHSSGNHAQALARAAYRAGIRAYVVMPSTTRRLKVEAVKRFGGQITFCEPTEEARTKGVEEVIAETGALLVHPFEDPRVICGQGTVALEIMSDFSSSDCVIVPIGGGGLISGCATVIKALHARTRVIGVEPSGADSARRSLEANTRIIHPGPKGIADGLLASVGERTFSLIRTLVDEVVVVDDEEIVQAMKLLWIHAKLVVEPAGAAPVAALIGGKVRAANAVAVLSGGNIACPWSLQDGALWPE